jgi:hypothetical protein
MNKNWYSIVCLADDLGLEFEYKCDENQMVFYRGDKPLAVLAPSKSQWNLTAPGFFKGSNNPKKLVNLVHSIA